MNLIPSTQRIKTNPTTISFSMLVVTATLYLFLWLLPNMQLLWYDRSVESVAKLLLCVLFFFVWHTAFKKLSIAIISALPFMLLWPFDIYFTFLYSTPPSTHVLNILNATSSAEAVDFVKGRIGILVGLMAISIFVCFRTVIVSKTMILIPYFWLRYLSKGIILSIIIILSISLFITPKVTESDIYTPPMLFRIDKINGVFPVGRVVIISEFYRNNRIANIVASVLQGRPLGAMRSMPEEQPVERELYVLIIGETGRPDHWSMNGYHRNTNKYLEKHNSHLINLPDVVSPWSNTIASIPVMLSRKPATSTAQVFGERSVLSAFNEIGFETYWLSNQSSTGGLKNFSIEADHSIFINANTRQDPVHGASFDENIIQFLGNIIDKKEKSQFIVIHLMGSHDAYQKRHPKEFNVFRPSLTDDPNANHHSVKNKTSVVNSYDNSIIYTDFVLSEIISLIESKYLSSVIVYASDHGESLFDGDCKYSGHGTGYRSNFPVSSFVWFSNEYEQNNNAMVEFTRQNATKELTTEYIFHSLLNFAKITNVADDTKSVASKSFRSWPRIVNAPRPLNWDLADSKGICDQLVAPK